jgi:hypothetical protein
MIRTFWSSVLMLFLLPSAVLAQDAPVVKDKTSDHKKGSLYFWWGYNRAFYNNSDIHFTGDGFDFTLVDVRADDMPEKWDPAIYLNPAQLAVPQFNFRMGYFIDDKHSISLGWDHMKYKLVQHQLVQVDGYIDPEVFDEYSGRYDEEYTLLTPSFLQYEHSDGFNFVRAAIDRRELLWHSKQHHMRLAFVGGGSVGLLFPWTDFTFMGERYRNWIHLSGWGISGHLSARLEFFRHFFLQVEGQWGYTRLSDVILMNKSEARASQSIQFFERSITGGVYFRIFKPK